MKLDLKTLWKNREQILEGITNKVFKKEHVEIIAEQRMKICLQCPFIDVKGSSCMVPGTQPCCSKCGCSLSIKTRALSARCGDEENPKWEELISEEEENQLGLAL
jgi:hypothetical protein